MLDAFGIEHTAFSRRSICGTTLPRRGATPSGAEAWESQAPNRCRDSNAPLAPALSKYGYLPLRDETARSPRGS